MLRQSFCETADLAALELWRQIYGTPPTEEQKKACPERAKFNRDTPYLTALQCWLHTGPYVDHTQTRRPRW